MQKKLQQPFRATGNAATRYSGTRTITTRQVGSPYALRDNTRGGGVNTYNSGGQNIAIQIQILQMLITIGLLPNLIIRIKITQP